LRPCKCYTQANSVRRTPSSASLNGAASTDAPVAAPADSSAAICPVASTHNLVARATFPVIAAAFEVAGGAECEVETPRNATGQTTMQVSSAPDTLNGPYIEYVMVSAEDSPQIEMEVRQGSHSLLVLSVLFSWLEWMSVAAVSASAAGSSRSADCSFFPSYLYRYL
jgi:hypothetical protein